MLTYDEIQVRRAWVEDLRSGRFAQIPGALNDSGNGRCCLGVLCEVTDPGNRRRWRGAAMPPVTLELRAGVGAFRGSADLACLNDEERWSFEDIARYIEEGGC